jgi:hypothetical protein
MSMQVSFAPRVLFAAAVSLLAMSSAIIACGSDEELPPASATADGQAQPPIDRSDGGTVLLPECSGVPVDREVDCTGKCGPVRDLCTGKVKQCGGCVTADGGAPLACDLRTNTCGPPKKTCAELGAECGTIKNTCGEYLDCPDTSPKGCPAGKECDPDTNKCRDCQQVTCKDLGFECGPAYLGCGPDTPSNYQDCGSCGAGRVCNGAFNICEPTCTPKSAKELCDAAKAKSGVECGTITNGCGGTVNCDSVAGYGCKDGERCGVRGLKNRCDPKETPDECKALGRNCGEITSVCTGLKVQCGTCPTGQVCNANGVCGAPCQPKTCADYKEFQCGVFDDACGGTLSCGCSGGGVCDNATKTCCGVNACGTGIYAGKCGQDLANGCGQNNLDCSCPTGQVCTQNGGASPPPATSTTGACCTPTLTATTYRNAGQCGTSLPNGCGQNNVNASCPSGGVCVNNGTGAPGAAPPPGTIGSCCTRTNECASQPPNTCASVPNSCRPGATVSCASNCTSDKICDDGQCCRGAPSCSGGGGEGATCNVTLTPTDPGCGSNRTCDCAGGRRCYCATQDRECQAGDGAGVCKTPLACGSGAYAGKCGTDLPDGLGGTIDCGCGTGERCTQTSAGVLGTCICNNPTGNPYTCANVPGGPGQGGDACGTFDNGCGGTLTCSCGGGQVCNMSANPNVCCTALQCPTPAVGSFCGSRSNGCGGTQSCGCPTGPNLTNFRCNPGTQKCECVPDTCRGRTDSQVPDLCGGFLNCGG